MNGISSGATGLLLLVFGNRVASLFGAHGPLAFRAVGIFLVAFAALVIIEGLRSHARANRVRLIIVLDVLWVIDSAAIVVLQLFGLSVLGYAAIAAVAVWVGLMAYLQFKGQKRLLA